MTKDFIEQLEENLSNRALAFDAKLEKIELGWTEEVTADSFVYPEEYLDFGEDTEDWNFTAALATKDKYKTAKEAKERAKQLGLDGIHSHKENGGTVYMPGKTHSEYEKVMKKTTAAKYKGKTVKLNKPFKTPGGPKKSAVYVKNDKGNVVLVRFGDPNMSIKKNDPARRKSFRARHKCDTPGPKWKARYWSCRAW